MYYELRSYDINPDRIDEYLVWASTKAVPFFKSRNASDRFLEGG